MSWHLRNWRTRLTIVRLEDRIVPATLIWTGDVDNRWGTNQLGNTNWAFDMLPHNGDSLVFPSGAQHIQNTNNLSGLNINNVTMQDRRYQITGNAIALAGNFLDSSPDSDSLVIWIIPLTLSPGTHTFTANASTADDEFAAISEAGGAASLTKAGAGQLAFASTGNTYTGLTTVAAGSLVLDSAGVAVPDDLLINGGTVHEWIDNQVGDSSNITVNSGGTFGMARVSDTVGTVSIRAGGTLNLVDSLDSTTSRLTTGDFSLSAGSTLSMKVRDASNDSDRITVNGAVQLGGTLQLSNFSLATVGTRLTLIDNDGADPVSGTFAGLPQGATLATGSELFSIDYAGGTGNDVVVTRLPGFRVMRTQIDDGSTQRSRITSLTVVFSDQATFASTPDTAFRLIRNTDIVPVTFTATATVVSGATVVTLNNFGGPATEFGSLADGRYTLTALASQIRAGGQELDGSGDGLPGDDFTLSDAQGLFRIFGDANGDQTVNGLDFGFFRSAFGAQAGDPNYLSYFDINGDGVINGFDFGQFKTRFGTMLP